MNFIKNNSGKIQIACAVILALAFLPRIFTSQVLPEQIGIRQSLTEGVNAEDFGPGRVFDLGFMHTMHTLPAGLHIQEFTGKDSLSVRTTQNNVISVDVAVKYEIIPGEAHLIVREGFKETYDDKVASISRDLLQKALAVLTNEAIQDTSARVKVAQGAVDVLNAQVSQYHVRVVPDGVVVRAIKFPLEYEVKLQQNQLYKMQGRLDTAKKDESEAIQKTDSVEKGIEKDVKLETEIWNAKVQEVKTKVETEIATVKGEAEAYSKTRRAAADALCSTADADGNLAISKAEALGEKLKTDALSSSAGRVYSAVIAADNFILSQNLVFNTSDPAFMQKFASMSAWRDFFLAR